MNLQVLPLPALNGPCHGRRSPSAPALCVLRCINWRKCATGTHVAAAAPCSKYLWDVMGFYSGLMGFYSGLMGFYSGLMGFYVGFY